MTNQLVNEQAAPLARVGSRDIRLDALRGLLLILMVINHSSTVVDGLTFQQLGYLSEAEGFVFLSGFVAGLTYSRMSVQQPAYCLWRRALLRARTIYLFHLVAFLACFLFLRGFAVGDAYWESWNPALQANFLPAILSGVVLLFQPRYMDILPMYCLFILATPAVVLLLKEKKWRRILGASLITWMLAQFGLRTQLLSLLPEGLPVAPGFFDPFAWQLVFVSGLLLGSFYYNGKGHSFRPQKWALIYCSFVIAVLFLARHGLFPVEAILGEQSSLISKESFGMLRVFDLASVVYLIASGYSRLKPSFVSNALAYLGRNSLQVFAFHLILVCLMNVVVRPAVWLGPIGKVLILLLACIPSLYLPAWLSERRKAASA